MSTTSIQQLQRALEIAEQISALENELKAVLAGNVIEEAPAPAAKPTAKSAAKPAQKRAKTRKQRTVSPEARARMAAAQKNRREREKHGQ